MRTSAWRRTRFWSKSSGSLTNSSSRRREREVAALQAQIEVSARQVASQSTAAKAAATQIQEARSQLDLAKTTTARLSPLAGKGYATPQQLDEAQTKREGRANPADHRGPKGAGGHSRPIGDTESLQAKLRGAEAAASLAEWDLNHTVLRAPFDGWVSGLDITEGAYASAGHAALHAHQGQRVVCGRELSRDRARAHPGR